MMLIISYSFKDYMASIAQPYVQQQILRLVLIIAFPEQMKNAILGWKSRRSSFGVPLTRVVLNV